MHILLEANAGPSTYINIQIFCLRRGTRNTTFPNRQINTTSKGKFLTWRACSSLRLLVASDLYRLENLANVQIADKMQKYTEDSEELVVLFTGYNKQNLAQCSVGF